MHNILWLSESSRKRSGSGWIRALAQASGFMSAVDWHGRTEPARRGVNVGARAGGVSGDTGFGSIRRLGGGGRAEGEAVEAGGVLPEDLGLDAWVDALHLAGDEVLAVGPDAVGVGEVGAPHDVVLAEDVDETDADWVALVGREALAAPVLRRLHLELEVLELVLPLEVHVLEDVGDPANAGLADDEADIGEAFEHAAVDGFHELVRHLELEAGDEGREGGARLELGEPFGVGELAAYGVDVHREPARVDRRPEGIPVAVVERLHVDGVRDLEAAHRAPLCDPLDLVHRRVDVVVRDAGDAGKAVRVGLAEVGEPFVVDAHDLDRRLAVVQPVRGPEDAVEHLAPNPVEVLVPHPELGLGEAPDPLGAVLVEALGGHPVRAVDHARHVLAPRRPHAVHEPEVRPAP